MSLFAIAIFVFGAIPMFLRIYRFVSGRPSEVDADDMRDYQENRPYDQLARMHEVAGRGIEGIRVEKF